MLTLRVLVSGLSTINSIGTNINDFWNNLLLGKSGITEYTKYNVKTKYAIVNDFEKHIAPGTEDLGRATSLLLTCIEDAVFSSGLDFADVDPGKIGISIGTTMGELGKHEDIVFGSPLKSMKIERPYMMTDKVASYLKISGPIWTVTNACAAGNYAIAKAYEDIKSGRADVMIAGGVDAFSLTAYAGFNSLRAITPELCRPFDQHRKGLVLGEGAGILILESEEHFLKRKNGQALASISGFGLTADAYHVTKPDPKARGAITAMELALKMAGITPSDIKFVSSHGTGTPSNDYMEAISLDHVFGKGIKTNSIKANIGHTLGAASAIEAVVCIMALNEMKLPPTINLLKKDPAITADVITEKQEFTSRYIMSNSYAFGGVNSSLILEKV